MVVGVGGNCTYNGLPYFDVTHLHPGYAVQSATLNPYFPDQSGDCGILLTANAPGSADPPSPTPLSGTVMLPPLHRGSVPPTPGSTLVPPPPIQRGAVAAAKNLAEVGPWERSPRAALLPRTVQRFPRMHRERSNGWPVLPTHRWR
jgi:hypothetical protein